MFSDTSKNNTRTTFFAWFLLLGTSFVIRLIFVLFYPIIQPEGTRSYDALFTVLLKGNGYEIHARSLYILYTKLIYFFFGPYHFPVIIGNIVMSVTTVWVTGLLSQKILSKKFFCYYPAFLAALNPIFIFWTGYVFPDTMFMLFFSLAVWTILSWQTAPSRRQLCYLGILSLALIFTRAHGLIVIPLLWGWLILSRFKNDIRDWYKIKTLNKALLISLTAAVALSFLALTAGTIYNIHQPTAKRTIPFTWLMGGHEPQNDMHIRLAGPNQTELVRKENKPLIMKDVNSFKEHLRIALVKTKFFWIPVRDTFSLKHKITNTIIYSFIYLFAFTGIPFLWKTRKSFLFFTAAVFILYTTAAIICFPDPEGRYRLPCDLLLIIIGSEGLGRMMHALFSLHKKTNKTPEKPA